MFNNVDWQTTGVWIAAAIAAVAAGVAWLQVVEARRSRQLAEYEAETAKEQAKVAKDHAGHTRDLVASAKDHAEHAKDHAEAARDHVALTRKIAQQKVFLKIEARLSEFMRAPAVAHHALVNMDSAWVKENIKGRDLQQLTEYLTCLDEVGYYVNHEMADEEAVIYRWGDDFAQIWTRHGEGLITEWRKQAPKLCTEFEKLAKRCIEYRQQ